MPLIRRKIEPSALSRQPSDWDGGVNLEYDLSAVTNVTLCNAVHQLASVLLAAESVYSQLQKELDGIALTAQNLCGRLTALEADVSAHNPKTVTVPEGDLRTFSLREKNFCSQKQITSTLFTPANQPADVAKLYNECSAAPTTLVDHAQQEGYVACEPIIGGSLKKEKLRKLNLDIETRRPASFVALRDWCSDDDTLVSELDLLPVSPATPLHHHPPKAHPQGQKLPLPEQRQEALSHRYPPKLVPIDVSGSGFKRMQVFRQSLVHFDYAKTKKRKRLKRRNTIANAREVQSSTLPSSSSCQERSSSSRFGFSLTDRSFDTSSTKTSCERELPHHLLGFHIDVPTPPRNVNYSEKFWNDETRGIIIDAEIHHSSPRREKKLVHPSRKLDMAGCHDDVGCQDKTGCHGDSNCHDNSETYANPVVKLREGSSREEGTRSSSGNWSGSSSTRTSIESDAQQHIPDTVPPCLPTHTVSDSSPVPSISQDSFISDSIGGISSSVLLSSDGTVTPSEDIPFADDSSAFSCDAEGYYTSFHTDSGLFHSDAAVPDLPEDFPKVGSDVRRNSTGTTNSSAASLKTVVMRNPDKKVPPRPPLRVSSLEKRESVVTVIHLNGSASSREDIPGSSSQNSEDSSRSTSSHEGEPSKNDGGRDSVASTVLSSSIRTDAVEGRKDDFRSKTTINAIPSMCAITPPPLSDEEKISAQVVQVENPLAAVETKLYQKSLQQIPSSGSAGIRQPGDGAVAPPAVVTRVKDGSTPNLILMSHKRASTGDLNASLKERLTEIGSDNKGPFVEPYTLDKSVGQRRAEIQSIFKDKIVAGGDPQKIPRLQQPSQQKTDVRSLQNYTTKEAEHKPSVSTVDSQRLIQHSTVKADPDRSACQKHGNLVDLRAQPQRKEVTNLVGYKQLPAMSSGPVPFSAAAASALKKNHPSNSLDRKMISKATPHVVSLDGEGKVVYSSDSLPRRKGPSASFEPGPYVKPPPIATTGSLKSKPAGYSSIQNTPLPPVPTEAVQPPQCKTTKSPQYKSQPPMSMQPPHSNPATSRITTVSHTLSGLSSQMQPRTLSEINALRNSKSNTSEDSSEIKLRIDARHETSSPSPLSSANYQYKKTETRCHTLPNPKHAQGPSYQSLSYQQQLIKQAYQQQQQLQQLQEEQQRRNLRNNAPSQNIVNKDIVGTSMNPVLAKIPEGSYPARQELQHSIYQTQNDILRQQNPTTDGLRQKNESALTQPTSMGPLGPSPTAYQAQIDPSLALAQQQMQAAQAASLGEHAVLHTRQHNVAYHPAGPASRVATPIQGTSSPNRLTNALQYPLGSQPGTLATSVINPSTDRVLIALANARLATASLKSFRAAKLERNTTKPESASACQSNIDLNPQVKEHFNQTKSSNFVRNNSYKLATTPLSLPNQNPSADPVNAYQSHCKAVKASRSAKLPFQRNFFNPRAKFYGARVKVNPNLLPRKSKENSLPLNQNSATLLTENGSQTGLACSSKTIESSNLSPNIPSLPRSNRNVGRNNLNETSKMNAIGIIEYSKPRIVGAIVKKPMNTEIW